MTKPMACEIYVPPYSKDPPAQCVWTSNLGKPIHWSKANNPNEWLKENDMKEKTYDGSSAFRLMAETPGRMFVRLGLPYSACVWASNDAAGQFMWKHTNQESEAKPYDIKPSAFLAKWLEYKPEQKRYPGVDVPRLMKETPGRKFLRKEPKVVWFTGEALVSCPRQYLNDNCEIRVFRFESADICGEWIEVFPEPEPKTERLTFDEAREAILKGRAKVVERYSSSGGYWRSLFLEDFQYPDWRVRS